MEIKSICIVGGGSSGWCTALAAAKHLEGVTVTIVEAEDKGTVGVGEAGTLEVTRFFNEYLGLDEKEWMRATDATYKVGGLYTNFNNLSLEDRIHHNLSIVSEDDRCNIYDWGIKKASNPGTVSNSNFARTYYAATKMVEEAKFSLRGQKDTWYACHLDASKFGKYASRKAMEWGVKRVEGTVVEVDVFEGAVRCISLASGKKVYADLFIDCTGFKSLLIGEAMGVEFIDCSDRAPNNQAIATRIPYGQSTKVQELAPCTRATAVSNGWVWEIPLWSRIGTGYVYSDKFSTRESAEEEFLGILSSKYSKAQLSGLELSHIPMKVGRQESAWKGNCVAIGLSASFVEPLESTGLMVTMLCIKELISLLKSNGGSTTNLMRSRFNSFNAKVFEEALDFVVLHYVNTERTDTAYWRNIQDSSSISPSMVNTIYEISQGRWDNVPEILFSTTSWEQIIAGFNIVDISEGLLIDGEVFVKDTHSAQACTLINYLESLENIRNSEVADMDTHYQYLKDNLYE